MSLALLFNGFVYWLVGTESKYWGFALVQAKLFFTGYLIEMSLSVDNLFVFLLIFTFFQGTEKVSAPRAVLGNLMGALLCE